MTRDHKILLNGLNYHLLEAGPTRIIESKQGKEGVPDQGTVKNARVLEFDQQVFHTVDSYP